MNWTLLHKYVSGECGPEEMREVEDWLHSDERNQRFIDSLKKIWEVEPRDEMEVNAKSAWSSFQKKISGEKELTGEDNPAYELNKIRSEPMYTKSYAHKRHGRALAFSLSAAAVILIALLFYQYVPLATEAPQPQSAMQEVMTEKGQRTTFRLSDGTRVQLNADSKLEISGKFMEASREVYLRGEAYFEVTRNPDKPFVVHTEETFTKVLGTKFGVRAYPDEDRVQVVVAEGKVALGSAEQSTGKSSKQITRNQIGILSENGQTKVFHAGDIEKYLGWKDGKLIFKDTPLREVKPYLERWFDITCILADSSLGSLELTASFSGEPMTEVLNVIALSMDVRYKREGRKITFWK